MEDIRSPIRSAFLEVVFDRPEANLEFDEYLLGLSGPGRILRVWESKRYFVVMGRNSDETDIDWQVAKELKIPVLRRKSGGGTVLQGPGCMNYTFVADVSNQTNGVKKAFNWVLSRVVSALQSALGINPLIRGISDLCIGDKKFSGNAQRRRGSRFYVHGTILYGFDISLMDRVLTVPRIRPEYRGNRRNEDFLINLYQLKDKREEFLSALAEALLEG